MFSDISSVCASPTHFHTIHMFKPHKDLILFLTEIQDTISFWFIYKKCAARLTFQTTTYGKEFLLSKKYRHLIFTVVYTHHKMITYVHCEEKKP